MANLHFIIKKTRFSNKKIWSIKKLNNVITNLRINFEYHVNIVCLSLRFSKLRAETQS